MNICPAVCTQQLIIGVNLLNLAVLAVFIFLIFKFRINLSRFFYPLLVLSVVIFIWFNVSYEDCGSGCSATGIYLEIGAVPNKPLISFPITPFP